MPLKRQMEVIMIKILIADDDAIIREGLKMIIETQQDMEFLGTVTDGKCAVELC
jgi:YesN/AraC family two-component response regulator